MTAVMHAPDIFRYVANIIYYLKLLSFTAAFDIIIKGSFSNYRSSLGSKVTGCMLAARKTLINQEKTNIN